MILSYEMKLNVTHPANISLSLPFRSHHIILIRRSWDAGPCHPAFVSWTQWSGT